MKTILFPTDFSEASENAAHYLMGLAGQVDITEITLLHSYATEGPSIIYMSDFTEPIVIRQDEVKAESVVRLNDFRTRLAAMTAADIGISEISLDKSLDMAIPEIIREQNIDLVVSGIEPYGKTTDQSTGTKAIKIALDLQVPVLIIPADATYQRIETLLLTCDLKNVARSVPKDKLANLLTELEARLIVVNIDFENRHYRPDTLMEQTGLHRALDATGAEYFFIEHKDIVHGIVEFAEEKKVQMIISIPKEHGVFDRLFHPGVTKKLASVSPLPIMLIHN
ncbi:universal stress protein [Flavihumibacter sp. R14]|nr:universal stress protein [Flavihumibacter soli]